MIRKLLGRHHKNSNLCSIISIRTSISLAILLLTIFFVFGCSQVFSKLDNPVDPASPNYQGYPTVIDPDTVEPVSVGDGSPVVFIPKLLAREVIGADLYHFQIATDSTFTEASIIHENATVDQNQYYPTNLHNLDPNVTYYWRVCAHKDNMWGAWSTDLATFSLSTTTPGDTVPVDGATIAQASPLFDWNDISNATGYGIQVSVSSDFSSTVVDEVGLAESNFTPTTVLLHGKTYYWHIAAKDINGLWTPFSDAKSFTTNFPATATPNFSPAGGTYTTDQTVTISCTTADSTIYYTLDGSTPTTASTRYTTGLLVTANIYVTISAIAIAPLYSESVIAQASYNPYDLLDTGPAGGLIFYDKGSYSDGWRYLEAAPSDQSSGIRSHDASYVSTGETAIGTGESNTINIVTSQGAGDYAALLCYNLVLGGYDDWFLPSKDELNAMYSTLKVYGVGDFSVGWYWDGQYHDCFYWSSSATGYGNFWNQNFNNGSQSGNAWVNAGFRVRPVRAF